MTKFIFLIAFGVIVGDVFPQIQISSLKGNWELEKIKLDQYEIDAHTLKLNPKVENKLKGNSDSVLISNLVLGVIKNKIGQYYAFNEKNVLVITDIKKHQEILTSYKFVAPNLIITENSVQEFYKIELLNATQMVLVDKNGLIDLPMKLYFIKKTISP